MASYTIPASRERGVVARLQIRAPSVSTSVKNLFLLISAVIVNFAFGLVAIPGDQPDFLQRTSDELQLNGYMRSISDIINPALGAHCDIAAFASHHINSCPLWAYYYLYFLRSILVVLVPCLVISSCRIFSRRFGNKVDESSRDLVHRWLILCHSPTYVIISSYFGIEIIAVISSFFMLCSGGALLWILFFLITFIVDPGSIFVPIGFIIFRYLSDRLINVRPSRYLIFGIAMFSAATFLGVRVFLPLISLPFIGAKISSIVSAYTGAYSFVYSKYPIVLRPGMLYFSISGATPMHLFSPISFALVILMFVAIFKSRHSGDDDKLAIIMAAVFLACFAAALPGYTQGKYYLPIFLFVMLNLTGYTFHKIARKYIILAGYMLPLGFWFATVSLGLA